MALMQEGKIIIDEGDTVDTNHVSAKLHHMKGSISKALQAIRSVESPKVVEIIMLQFGNFDPFGVPALKKTMEKFMQNNFSNSKKGDTWTSITSKRRKCQRASKLQLLKIDTRSSANLLQPMGAINTKLKCNYTPLQRVGRKVALQEFFLKMLLVARA